MIACKHRKRGYAKAIEVARCKTVDLEVPATAEIVIEGTISTTETTLEDPMGEFHGANRFIRVLVTDDDIDLSDLRDVFWAWNSRCHPRKGNLTLSDESIHPGEPIYTGHDSLAPAKDDIEVLNCLLPRTGKRMNMKSTAFADDFSQELQDRVIALWDE